MLRIIAMAMVIVLILSPVAGAGMKKTLKPVENNLQQIMDEDSQKIQKYDYDEPRKTPTQNEGSSWWKWTLGGLLIIGGIAAASGGGGGGSSSGPTNTGGVSYGW